jgi:hypothetical protein
MAIIKCVTTAFALAGLALVGATASSANEAGCDSRSKILSALDQEYKEAPVGIGLTQTGRVIELLVSKKGSWTLLATGPTGMSCLIAAGENWEAMALPVGDKS